MPVPAVVTAEGVVLDDNALRRALGDRLLNSVLSWSLTVEEAKRPGAPVYGRPKTRKGYWRRGGNAARRLVVSRAEISRAAAWLDAARAAGGATAAAALALRNVAAGALAAGGGGGAAPPGVAPSTLATRLRKGLASAGIAALGPPPLLVFAPAPDGDEWKIAVGYDPALLQDWRGVREFEPPGPGAGAAEPQPIGGLWPHQEAIVDHLTRPGDENTPPGLLRRQAFVGGCVYLQLGTGLGKSRTAMTVIARMRQPALVVVPTKELQSQFVAEVGERFPWLNTAAFDRSKPVGPRGGKFLPSAATHDVVVVVRNSAAAAANAALGLQKPRGKAKLARWRADARFFDGYGLVVLDEAHELHAPTLGIPLLRAAMRCRCVLGLSATPSGQSVGRLEDVVPLYLGPPLDAVNAIPGCDVPAAEFPGRVRTVRYYGDPAHVVPGEHYVETIQNFILDPARTRLVALEVAAILRDPAHSVFVFAEYRDYLVVLRDAIAAAADLDPHAFLVEGEDNFAEGVAALEEPEDLDGHEADAEADAEAEAEAEAGPVSGMGILRGVMTNADAAERTEAYRARTRVVLTTYGYSRRGVSIKRMTAMVLATPRRNGLTQITGRITRMGGAPGVERLVVDLVDASSLVAGQAGDRRTAYKVRGWGIDRVDAAFDDPALAEAPAPVPVAEAPAPALAEPAPADEAPAEPAPVDVHLATTEPTRRAIWRPPPPGEE